MVDEPIGCGLFASFAEDSEIERTLLCRILQLYPKLRNTTILFAKHGDQTVIGKEHVL